MRTPRQYLSERYPWLNLNDSLAAAAVLVLVIVAIWPHSGPVIDLVLATAIPGLIAAIVWGLTFWQKARVQIGRLNFRYKRVRRIAGIAALSCLPVLLLQQTSIYLRGPNILREPAVDVTGLSEPYPKPAKSEIRVVVAIAHLEGDDGHRIETNLREALSNLDPRFHVTPVVLNRTIAVSGRPRGIAHLDALGAVSDVRVNELIWGSAKRDGSNALGPLYETSFGNNPSFGGAYLPADFTLPELPEDDQSHLLSLMVASQSAELMGQGAELGDALRPLIEHVRAIADDPRKSSGWSADTRARVNLVLGIASEISGAELKSEDSLNAAVGFLQRTQSDWTHENNPLEWAIAQRNLGSAFIGFYDLKPLDKPLHDAIAAFQNALAVYQSRSDGLDSAHLQFELGSAFFDVGEHEAGSVSMRRAADYFRAAAQGFDIRYYPGTWAATQYNLGDALCEAAARDANAKEYEDAIGAEREALKIYRKRSSPIQWAGTQTQIAASLEQLGDMTDNREDSKQAIALCRQVLDGYPRESDPDLWTSLESTLGGALVVSYRLDKDSEFASQAEIAFRAALEELSVRDQPEGWAIAKDGLGRALVELGEARSDAHYVEQGVDSISDALKIVTRDRDPVVWAWTKFDLGDALVALEQRDGEVVRLKQAIDAYRDALSVSSKDVMPDLYAKAQDNLKVALDELHRRGSDGS